MSRNPSETEGKTVNEDGKKKFSLESEMQKKKKVDK